MFGLNRSSGFSDYFYMEICQNKLKFNNHQNQQNYKLYVE